MSKTHHGSLLVVDDDKHVCQAMADYLRGRGHRTETAFTCVDAIERMRPFDGQAVRLSGTFLHRDDRWMLELADSPDAIKPAQTLSVEQQTELRHPEWKWA